MVAARAKNNAKRDKKEVVVPFGGGDVPPTTDELQPERHMPDDDEIALEIADKWDGRAMFLRYEWYVWQDGYWQKRDLNQVYQSVRRDLRGHRKNGIQVSARKISGVTRLLEFDMFKSDEKWSEAERKQANYLCLRNGMLNLNTYQLEPHDPSLLFVNRLDFDYDPAAKAPTFQAYLDTSLVQPDGTPDHMLQGLFLQGLGYCLTTRTDLKASFWFVGAPNSGKSTAIALVRNLMGEYHITIDLNQLETNRFLLSSIVGKRVVSFTEASGSSLLPDWVYKTMVGGQDEIYADVKNRPAISFRPTAKFIWAMNEPPRFTDRSGATTNRLKVVPFIRTVPAERLDPQLEQKLIAERSGILNILLEELRALNTFGFYRPEQSDKWLRDYIQENDTEGSFLEDVAIRGDGEVSAGVLYRTYRSWCESFGFKSKNINQVSKEWERLGLKRRRVSSGVMWGGIRLKEHNQTT